MLLAIDTGNTNSLFAIHDGQTWRARWRSATDATRTADDYAVWIGQLLGMQGLSLADIDDCIISSVVPQSLFHLRNLVRRYLHTEPLIVAETIFPDMAIRIGDPGEVGADRLVNAVGAQAAHDGALLVIDSGTATTFDVIAEDGAFEGGVIAPGINLSMRALHEAAARLPRIAIACPAEGKVIGQSTVSAMQSGVYWGYLAMIDGLAERIRQEYAVPLKVIATGGVAAIFEGASRVIEVYDPDVTIRGLYTLYLQHRKTADV